MFVQTCFKSVILSIEFDEMSGCEITHFTFKHKFACSQDKQNKKNMNEALATKRILNYRGV